MRTDDDAYTTLVDKFGYDTNDGVPSFFAELDPNHSSLLKQQIRLYTPAQQMPSCARAGL